MAEFNLHMADLTIGVKTFYDYTLKYCSEYLSDMKPDFFVSTTQEKIDAEIEISEFDAPRDYAESICIYREIAEILPLYDRCVFHGASIEYEGNGYIFTAASGTGKTTHIRLWKKFLGNDNVKIVNGDKPILNIRDDGTTIYSTPYAGKEGYQNHSQAPLKAICIVKRGTTNKITKVASGDVLIDIMKQMYRPFNPEPAVKSLELLDRLLKLPVYVLECDISEDAVKTSFEALTGLNYSEHKIKDTD